VAEFRIVITVDPGPAQAGSRQAERALAGVQAQAVRVQRHVDGIGSAFMRLRVPLSSIQAGIASGLAPGGVAAGVLGQQFNLAARSAASAAREIRGVGQSLAQAQAQAASFGSMLLRVLAVEVLRRSAAEVLRVADTYTLMQNRLRVVTSSQRELNDVTRQLFESSTQTRSSFQSTAELYSRLAINARDLGLSQAETVQFTQSLNQAIILSGATAQEASAGLIQFSQGLASGTLRGDELRSVLEQLPVVADTIADRLGVARGELRGLAEQGKLTSQEIVAAFRDAAPQIAERFAKTIPTIAQSVQVLNNKILEFVGSADTAVGGVRVLGAAVRFVGDHIAVFAVAAGVAVVAVLRLVVMTKAAGVAFKALGPALANPFVLAAVVAASFLAILHKITENTRIAKETLDGIADIQTDFGKFNGQLLETQKRLALLTSNFEKVKAAADFDESGRTAKTYRREIDRTTDALKALRKGADDAAKAAERVVREHKAIVELNKELDDEAKLLRLVGKELDVQTRLHKELNKLAEEGAVVSDTFIKEIEARIRNNLAMRQQQQLLGQVRSAQEELSTGVAAFTALVDTGTLTAEEYAAALRITFNADPIKSHVLAIKDELRVLETLIKSGKEAAAVEKLRIEARNKGLGADGLGEVAATLKIKAALEAVADVMGDLRGAQEEIARGEAALNMLMAEGTLQAGELERAMRKAFQADPIRSAIKSTQDEIEVLRVLIAHGKEAAEIEKLRIDARNKGLKSTDLDVGDAAFLAKQRSDLQAVAAATEQARTASVGFEQQLRAVVEAQAALTPESENLRRSLQEQEKALLANRFGYQQITTATTVYEEAQRQLTEQIALGTLSANQIATAQAGNRAQFLGTSQAARDMFGPLADYTQQLEELKILQSDPAVTGEMIERGWRAAQITLLESQQTIGAGFERFFLKAKAQAEDFAKVAESALGVFADAATSALVEVATTGTVEWKKLGNAVVQELIRIIAQLLIAQLLGFGATSAAGAGLAGAKQTGGTVQPGQRYLVGEGGPEVFTPGRTGSITPNASQGGGSSSPTPVTVQNIIVQDPNEIPRQITGARGQQAVMAVIQQNAGKVRAMVSGGGS